MVGAGFNNFNHHVNWLFVSEPLIEFIDQNWIMIFRANFINLV